MLKSLFAGVTLGAVATLAPTASAAVLYGYTASDNLVRFDSSAPGTILQTLPVTGTVGGESLHGIDFRPATGELYGINATGSRIYTISLFTGVASQVGSDVAATLGNGLGYGFDFNPVVDRIRVTDGGPNTNLRYHPVTGALVSTDGPLTYNVGDVNVGNEPNIVGAAYINNFPGTTTTTLYGIDALNDVLVTIIPPNSGGLNTVGSLGIDALGTIGFDVDAMGNAFMSSTITQSVLYSVDLTTGAATAIGSIGNGVVLRGLAARLPNSAVVPEPVPAVLLGLGLLGLLRRRARG